MHCFLGIVGIKLFRIVIGDRFIVLVEQSAFAIPLENRAEIPPVAVIISELGIL